MEAAKKEWVEVFEVMLADFRAKHPDDRRSDDELLASLMEFYVKAGIVKKVNGKYQLPKIKNPKELIAMISGPISN